MTPEQQTPASVVEAATELSHFAWSAVRADCVEAEMNLNRLLGNLRAALTQGESRQTGVCICVARGDGPEGCGICNETGKPHPAAPTPADGGGE